MKSVLIKYKHPTRPTSYAVMKANNQYWASRELPDGTHEDKVIGYQERTKLVEKLLSVGYRAKVVFLNN
jgi:hypothetical protein